MGLISLGPLTLECMCEGGAGVPCSVTALDLIGKGWWDDGLGDFEFRIILAGVGAAGVANSGDSILSLSVGTWLPNLASVTAQLNVGRSSSSDYFATGGGMYYIRATLTCVEPGGGTSTKYAYSFFRGANEYICPDNGRGAIQGSAVIGEWWHSRPLSSCTTMTIDASGGFAPIDADQVQGGTSGTAKWCLCASGGTGYYDPGTGDTLGAVYKFQIVSGTLPSGQTLDEDTGCIEGEPDGGDPGTSDVTFRVLDVRDPNGGYAEVTCGIILPGCTGAVLTPAGNWFI